MLRNGGKGKKSSLDNGSIGGGRGSGVCGVVAKPEAAEREPEDDGVGSAGTKRLGTIVAEQSTKRQRADVT